MTEIEARRILGRELAESWLRMPDTSRETLRLLLKQDELRAVAVLEGCPLPDPPPEADLDSVLELHKPVLQVAVQTIEHAVEEIPEPDFKQLLAMPSPKVPLPNLMQAEKHLPAPDFVQLLYLPLPESQLAEIKQAEQRLPEPDFSFLNHHRASRRPGRRSYPPGRYLRNVDPNARCLTRLAWAVFWMVAVWWACSSWHW